MFKHWKENVISMATGVSLAIVIFMIVMGPTAAYAAVNRANDAGGTSTLTTSGDVTVNATTLQLVKQVYTTAGVCLASIPLDSACSSSATSTTVPAGTTLKFLIFVKNASDIALTDIRFSDALDLTAGAAGGFTYVPGQIRRTQIGASAPIDTATAAAIFADADGASGVAQLDTLTNADFAAFISPNLTVGGSGAAGNNATLIINAKKSFGVIFQVTKN